MNIKDSIRKLYTPVQPTVKQAAQAVTYQEFLPHASLRHVIYCYWQLKTTEPLQEQFTYRVVADGCIDIFFELNNPQESFVMGFCKKYTEFPLGNHFNYVGIRFLPTMFPQLYHINAATLSNRFEALDAVVPTAADFIGSNINIQLDQQAMADLFDRYFIQLLNKKELQYDNRLYEAIDLILQNYGVLHVETQLNTGISPRQLRRLFEFYIGDTAKTFCKVVRFQNILRAKPSAQSLRQNKLFFNQGYYDQAHFIKEFRNFYGVTPAKAFQPQ